MEKSIKGLVEQAASLLIASGAREVYLFGSAAKGVMREDSDVDMAVSGLPPQLFFKLMGQAGDILGKPLDLIDLDEVTPFTRYLKEEGELLRVV
ncbi:MAG: nucleotidyltransferase domain-containing protein [bacterium]|nr:nucleotidyltransferase domain-containing protein [bacterium]